MADPEGQGFKSLPRHQAVPVHGLATLRGLLPWRMVPLSDAVGRSVHSDMSSQELNFVTRAGPEAEAAVGQATRRFAPVPGRGRTHRPVEHPSEVGWT
jgi:hypothetical protein